MVPFDCVSASVEMVANQFNAIPRPATVLITDGQVEVIRRRETLQDILMTQQLPARLLGSGAPTPVAVAAGD